MTKKLPAYIAAIATAVLMLSTMVFAAPQADAQTGESYFVLYGEPGEYISQGNDVFHAESSDITFSPSVNYDNGVSVMIDVHADGAFVERWKTDFAAPGDVALVAGDSFLATRFPFQAADDAGLSVSGAGRGCNTLYGEFAIRELTIDAAGDVENFAADFRQSCDGGAPIVGGVRINSTLDNPDRDFTISPAPTGDTNFVLYGEPGEYISQGADLTLVQGSGVHFSPSVNYDNGITVMVDVSDSAGTFIERWTANFAAPGDVPLAAGDSFLATRFPFQAADNAGLSVSGDGRGCNTLFGEFKVYELSVDSVGQVDNFAADFRQSCDGGVPIVGGVRVNSTVPTTDPDFTISPAPTGDTNFVLYGQPGEYITQGADLTLVQGSGVHFSPSVNYDNGITVMVDVRDSAGTFIEQWTANLAAPGDVPLAAGDEFTGATRFGFQAVDAAGLSVSGDGRGCNTLVGEFKVYELSFNSVGQVDNFAADFRQSCDGGTPIVGGVRVNSTVPTTDPDFSIEPPTPVDTTPPEAAADLIQTGRIKGTSSNFVVSAVCTDDLPGVELVSAEINGISVSPGQKVKLTISNRERVTTRKGKLTIQSASITLTVTCEDAAGNTSVDTVQPSYDS